VPLVSLALRSWVRYALPLTVIAVVAFVPIFVVAMRVQTPVDAAATKGVALVGYELAALAWAFQLAVVGAVAPAVRAVAARESVSQLAMLRRGFRGLAQAIVPATVVAGGVIAGGLALVIPGIVVLGLLAPSAASREVGKPLPAPFVDALAATRKILPIAIVIAVALLAIDLAIPVALHKLIIVPVPAKNPPLELLDRARLFVRATAGALAVISPVIAVHVAASYELNRSTARATDPAAAPSPAPS
jgi:hypothetical protein